MKKFRLTVDAELDAENIRDACARLAGHFDAIAKNEDKPTIFYPGSHLLFEPVREDPERHGGPYPDPMEG